MIADDVLNSAPCTRIPNLQATRPVRASLKIGIRRVA